MPPKIKITKEDIVQTALSLVREGGEGAINARSIAEAMACSTQPIFSNFAGIGELRAAVADAGYALYLDFISREVASGKYPTYKAMGMAYIRFAREEKELFKLLFMRDRTNEALDPAADFLSAVDMIAKANGVSREVAERMHLEMWACVHGIGTMLATAFLPLDEEFVSDMLSDVYQGLRAKHGGEGN